MAEILNLELKWFLYQTLILVQKWDLTRFNMVLKLCLPLINQIWILLTNFYGATSNYGPIKIPTTPGPPWWPQLAVRLLICQGTLSRGPPLSSKPCGGRDQGRGRMDQVISSICPYLTVVWIWINSMHI